MPYVALGGTLGIQGIYNRSACLDHVASGLEWVEFSQPKRHIGRSDCLR